MKCYFKGQEETVIKLQGSGGVIFGGQLKCFTSGSASVGGSHAGDRKYS